MTYNYVLHVTFACGLVVRIPGFHPGGPGSILAIESYFFTFLHFWIQHKISQKTRGVIKGYGEKSPYLPTPSNVIGNKENVNALFMNKGGRLASGHLPS